MYAALVVLCCLQVGPAAAQTSPPCPERPTTISDTIWVNIFYWCHEQVIFQPGSHPLSYTALGIGDDGTLYSTRPMQGEVWALHDTTGDGLQDHPTRLLAGLHYPNALAFADGALYIAGDGVLYRWQDETLTTLVDDLPAGYGFLPAGLVVHGGHLYLGIPAPCDACIPDDARAGTVMRFDLDGANGRIVARGLRYPAGLAVRGEALWVTDTARDGLDKASYFDELNALPLADSGRAEAEAPHFGWPFCIGADNQPDLAGAFDCAAATAPVMVLRTYSTPIALATHDGTTFRHLRDNLILGLSGGADYSLTHGHQLLSIEPDGPDGQILTDSMVPMFERVRLGQRVPYEPPGYWGDWGPRLNMNGVGLWPRHLYGIAINAVGWIYYSLGDSIHLLRPGDHDACDYLPC